MFRVASETDNGRLINRFSENDETADHGTDRLKDLASLPNADSGCTGERRDIAGGQILGDVGPTGLGRSGMVDASRGLGGGTTIAVAGAELSLWESLMGIAWCPVIGSIFTSQISVPSGSSPYHAKNTCRS